MSSPANQTQKCNFCRPGTYSYEKGKTKCRGTVCAAGTKGSFGDKAPSVPACQLCQKGHYSAAEGCSDCAACRQGHANPDTGSSESSACAECKKNHWNNQQGQSGCTQCGQGLVSKPGSTNESECTCNTADPFRKKTHKNVCGCIPG